MRVRSSQRGSINSPSVLFVDDEPHITCGISVMLRREPFHIHTANSAEDALALLDRESIDVLVTDEKMPSMPGSELLSQVRRLHPNIVSMMLSGEATLDGAIRAINKGEIFRFLKKPLNPIELAASIQNALEHRTMILELRRLRVENADKDRILRDLELQHPGITQLETDANGVLYLP